MSAMVDLVSELKKSGAVLYCWSTGGASYAESSAAELGLSGCFTGYLPKPQLMLDDVAIKNWKLVEMHPAECASQTAAELLSRICR